MPCQEYERLQKEYKREQEEWAYFAYEQNKPLRRTSDSKSRQMAKAAKAKMSETMQRITWHWQGCEICKSK